MDLSSCTPGQRETVLTLDAPLMVSAGAGSGKTFTLTQRIVNALSPSNGGAPALESIDQVLAITFTKKAAAELRARVKGALRAEGLGDQALLADDAWILTIHGMAARILRENALELGLDPAFQVIEQAEADELLQQAVEAALGRIEADGGPLANELLTQGSLLGSGSGDRGLVGDALALIGRAQALPAGIDGIRFPQAAASPGQMMRQLYELGLEVRDAMVSWEGLSSTEAKCLEAVEDALQGAEAWLADSSQAACGFDDAGFDASAYRRAFFAFPPTSAQFGTSKKRACAELFDSYRFEYRRLADEVEGAIAVRQAQGLLGIARIISEEFRRLKGPSRLDNDDLLRRCLEGLRDHPQLAERYRRRFRLIMVDEFQDTDQTQVEVLGLLAAPGLANLCAVGDAQQSIYRFRGADVNVFQGFRDSLRASCPQARFPQLASNFRSHGDVLAVVEKVFSQPDSFGEGFLRLEAAGQVNASPDSLFDGRPRVSLDVIHYQRGKRGVPGVARTEAVRLSAERIAQHFGDLHREGTSPSSMALLLGTTTNASAYIEALRREGLESVMVAGSVFSEADEPKLVGALLRYAVNGQDEGALMEVLLSPLFAISDDALLALAYGPGEDGSQHHRSFARAFSQKGVLEGSGLPEADIRAVGMAREALRRFSSEVRAGQPVAALRRLLVGSGLLAFEEGQGAEGLAVGGNYARALHMVEGLMPSAAGVASLSAAYDAALAASKQAPGVLASAGSEFVRIMTVHGSKGLQFDHVAIAEVRNGRQSRLPALLAENDGGSTYALASYDREGVARGALSKLRSFPCDEEAPSVGQARTPGELARSLEAFSREQEMAEARRLLYVAMTRAVKSLYLAYATGNAPDKAYEADGIYAEVYQALQWAAGEGDTLSMCDYGGTAPARVAFSYLTPERLAEQQASRADAVVDGRIEVRMPCYALKTVPPAMPAGSPIRRDVRSYSSLAHGYDPLDPVGEASGDGLAGEGLEAAGAAVGREAPEDATALGSAFHRLAQRAIVAAAVNPLPRQLKRPASEVEQAQARLEGISASQAKRLDEALSRWFGSALAERFASCSAIAAEVPFMVLVEGERGPLYLEGEIDGLADAGDGHALLIDYKTGGSPDESPEQLRAKHLQQAQCYAYALLDQGFSEVEACFIRVEQPDPDDPSEPQVVPYRFTTSDVPALATAIYAAYE